jgi:hypothetical protein
MPLKPDCRMRERARLLFTNEADVHLLLSCLQPAAHSQQLLQILKASQEPEPKANIGGNLTVAVIKTPAGRQSFRVSIDEGKRKHVLERVEQVRQSAHWALRDRIKDAQPRKRGQVAVTGVEIRRQRTRTLLLRLTSPIATCEGREQEGDFASFQKWFPGS